ncbi:MAG: class I SAM-dependent methyltransferase [Candidatus Binatia bacterium]|nr:class I SAM-dependent methyltransferase [Candidatus Binatia bacterium]
MDKFTSLNSELYRYLLDHCSPRPPILDELAAETAERLGPLALMQISPEQGAFMSLLVRLMGVRSALEIGTFTGYSALCVAMALPEDGRLLCCDLNEEWTAMARRYWDKAGVGHKIQLRLGPALETLRQLPEQELFDFAFVDADKASYPAYFEEVLRRLRSNGVIVFDNVLWMGAVADPSVTDPETVALRELNAALAKDPRVEVVMLPVADGITLARKR